MFSLSFLNYCDNIDKIHCIAGFQLHEITHTFVLLRFDIWANNVDKLFLAHQFFSASNHN